MESVVSKEDATVKELSLILREWLVIWKQLYKVIAFHMFQNSFSISTLLCQYHYINGRHLLKEIN